MMISIRRICAAGLATLLLATGAAPAMAAPTEIMVRVMSKDAKFIGSSMGGVRIVLRDAETGAILASGTTTGGTGNTKRLMQEPRQRHALLSDDQSAGFKAVLDLVKPVLVEVEATGPLAQPQSAMRVTARQWVVPGRSITGDGWMLEMPGFVVDILDPPAHISLAKGTASVKLAANVTMMCGCPIEPGGLWNANDYEVTAMVSRGGKAVSETRLAYAGRISQFAVDMPVAAPGAYEVTVFAYDKRTGNTGLDRTSFIVP